VTVAEALNERELSRYVSRVSDRWPLERALLGGARADDARGAAPQRERGPEYVVVLVSEMFDGVPWLERVYQCGALWDAAEMGDRADAGRFQRFRQIDVDRLFHRIRHLLVPC